jgi:hypothetical protein
MQAAGAAVGQLRFAVCLVAYVLCASSAMVFSKARLPRPLHPSENPSRPHQLETLYAAVVRVAHATRASLGSTAKRRSSFFSSSQFRFSLGRISQMSLEVLPAPNTILLMHMVPVAVVAYVAAAAGAWECSPLSLQVRRSTPRAQASQGESAVASHRAALAVPGKQHEGLRREL